MGELIHHYTLTMEGINLVMMLDLPHVVFAVLEGCPLHVILIATSSPFLQFLLPELPIDKSLRPPVQPVNLSPSLHLPIWMESSRYESDSFS